MIEKKQYKFYEGEKAKMIIGLNAGHTLSGYGTGAVGFVKETDYNRLILNRLTSMLKEKGHSVINCTVDKSNNDLSDIVSIANKQRLDIFISLHLNCFDNPQANGVEVFSYGLSGTGYEYAKKVQSELVNRIGWSNRGVKNGDWLYVLKNTRDTAILIEMGFCSNQEDMNKWNTENICKGIFKAITGIEYEGSQKPVEPPVSSSNLYRVRLSWDNANSQKGAYSSLQNAINECNKYSDYKVFDNSGKIVYQKSQPTPPPISNIKEYVESGKAVVCVNALNVRDNPSVNANVVAKYYNGESFNYNYVRIDGNKVWVRYTSNSGYTRWVCVKENNTRYANCY